MYKIERTKNQLIEQFQLGNETVEFTLNPTAIVSKFAEYQGRLVLLQEQYRKEPSEISLGRIGETVLDLFQLLFGEQTEKILLFFDGDWTEMLEQVYPYIMFELYPKLKKASIERAKQMKRG